MMRSRGKQLRASLLLAAAALSNGCGVRVAPTLDVSVVAAEQLDPEAFVAAKAKLAALREQVAAPRTESLSIELDAPYLPSAVRARGSVAVRPPDALRMILIGPGGTTAMDLWMAQGRFRFDVPALGRVLRGERSNQPETRKGLPVEFLRWWMFEPLGGRLMAARRTAEGDLEVLLDEPGRTTTAVLLESGAIRAHRRWVGPGGRGRFVAFEEEWLEATGVGCANATYRQKSTSLVVVARCQSTRPSVRDAALVEPVDPPGGRE